MVIKRDEADEYLNYFKIPYILVRDPKFKELWKNKNAVCLYGMMRDQVTLSLKNNFVDEKGVYQFFKVDRIQKELGGISRETANQAKKKLIEFGLIEVEKQFNGADKIYVNKVTEAVVESSKNELPKVQKMNCESSKNELPKVQNLDSNQPNYNQPNLTRLTEPEGGSDTNLFSEKGTPAPSPLKIFHDLWVGESGQMLSPLMIEQVEDMLKEHGIEVVKLAVLECVNQGKMYFAYLKSILDNWKRERLTTAELVKNRQKPKRQQEYDPVGNIPKWSSMHPDNVGKSEEKDVYNPERWKKWLEEKKKNGR